MNARATEKLALTVVGIVLALILAAGIISFIQKAGADLAGRLGQIEQEIKQ